MTFIRPRQRRQPLNGTTSDGTPVMNIGLPPEIKQALGYPVSDPTAVTRYDAAQVQEDPKPQPAMSPDGSPSPDASYLTTEQKRAAMDESVRESQRSPEPAAEPTPRPRSAELIDEYDALSRTPAKDRNGRIKSILLNLLDNAGAQARNALSSGRPVDAYGLAAIAGAAAGGGARGGLDPGIDERRKREARMVKLGDEIKQQLQLESIQARSAVRANQTANAADRAARTGAKQRLQLRAKQRGGTLDPNDAETKADLELLGIKNLPAAKGGKGLNAQLIKPDGKGHFYYFSRGEDGNIQAQKIDSETGELNGVSEAELSRMEAERQENNRRTAEFVNKYGRQAAIDAGLSIIPSVDEEMKGKQSAALVPQPAPQEAAPGVQTVDPTGIRPRRAKPEAIPSSLPEGKRPYGQSSGGIRPRGSRRSGSARSGSSAGTSKNDSINSNVSMGEIGRIDDLNTQAKIARQNGDVKKAEAYEAESKRRARRLMQNPNFKGKYRITYDPDDFMKTGGRYPAIEPVQDKAHADAGRVIDAARIPEIMEEYNLTEEEALREISEQGYTIKH